MVSVHAYHNNWFRWFLRQRLSTFHCVYRLPNSSTPRFPFLQCEGMTTVRNWPLHVHYGITLWAYVPFWTSRKRQSQMSKKNHNTTCSKSCDHTLAVLVSPSNSIIYTEHMNPQAQWYRTSTTVIMYMAGFLYPGPGRIYVAVVVRENNYCISDFGESSSL